MMALLVAKKAQWLNLPTPKRFMWDCLTLKQLRMPFLALVLRNRWPYSLLKNSLFFLTDWSCCWSIFKTDVSHFKRHILQLLCFSSPWFLRVSRVPLTRSLDFCVLTRIEKVQTKGCITLTTWCPWCCLKLQHLQGNGRNQPTSIQENSSNKTWGRTEIKTSKEKGQMIQVQANISCLLSK